MRWLAWSMLIAVAGGAGAAGPSREFNPVRAPAHASFQTGIQRIVLKLNSAQRTQQAAPPWRQRVSALVARRGLTLRALRPVTETLHAIVVEPAVAGEPIAATLERLRADPEVEYAEINQRRFPHALPNDPLFSQQWYLQPSSATTPAAIDALTAWDTSSGSTAVVIADLDTGVRFEHPDLLWAGSGGRLLPGYTLISDTFVSNDGDTYDTDASDPGDWVTMQDSTQTECSNVTGPFPLNSSWHGTRTAGLLGALTDNGTGIAGVTWHAWVLPVRVLGKCGGLDSDIVAGMRWAAGLEVLDPNGNPVPNNPYPARIENLSLGATGTCPADYAQTVSEVAAVGVLVVASAGNEGGPVDAPANCPGVAGVAGIRHAGTKVGYSSLGPEVALSAPAGNCVNTTAGSTCLYPITSTTNEGTTSPGANSYTDELNNPNLGTSFSAPQVSGIAALMLSVNGNLTPAQLTTRMQQSSLPFPQSSVGETTQPPMCHVPTGSADVQNLECICTLDGQTCGAGMANASGAVSAALRPIAALRAPASVASGMSVTLDASGSAAACQHAVASYQWMSSDPNHPVTSSSGPTTSVTAPATGSFTVTLTVTDDAGKQDVATVTLSPTLATTGAPSAAGTTACLAAVAVASPVSVSVSPTSTTVTAGGTQVFSASVGGTLNTQVTWQVNQVTGGNATVGMISSAGTYSAPASVPSPSIVSVTAISAADPSRTGSAQVTIIAAASSGGGGGGGGGGFDLLTLATLAGVVLSRRSYSRRSAASSHERCARR
jgi:serine protease